MPSRACPKRPRRVGGKRKALHPDFDPPSPEDTLRSYVSDAGRLEGAVPIILRGFIGGMTRIMPTMTFIQKILKRDPGCDFEREMRLVSGARPRGSPYFQPV